MFTEHPLTWGSNKILLPIYVAYGHTSGILDLFETVVQ